MLLMHFVLLIELALVGSANVFEAAVIGMLASISSAGATTLLSFDFLLYMLSFVLTLLLLLSEFVLLRLSLIHEFVNLFFWHSPCDIVDFTDENIANGLVFISLVVPLAFVHFVILLLLLRGFFL